ncbi:MAG: MFS transporter [Deltaproteobacteria bacterium]|jgi:PAT family beta-lactamase induction signal transducer AmpG|nr:MFS transporter [Deltaproteobacteria bacterium]
MFEKFSRKKYVWAFSTYFTEGFPFSLIRTVSGVFFRDLKVSLESIGLTSLFGLPWILKFFWAPLLDRYSTKRKWLLVMQGSLCLLMFLVAFIVPLDSSLQIIATLLFGGAILSATHDTAIDGYYLEALDENDQAKYVGYRVMAYRIAMMTGTGVIVTIGTVYSWFFAYLAAASIFSLFFIFHLFALKEVQKTEQTFKEMLRGILNAKVLLFSFLAALFIILLRWFFNSVIVLKLKNKYTFLNSIHFSHWIGIILLLSLLLLALTRNKIKKVLLKNRESNYARSFLTFVDRDQFSLILIFIIFLRAGEFMLTTMVSPFIVDLGIKNHYGRISAGIGLPCSIGGAILGGWLISRFSLKKVAFPFLLFQNSTNLVYMGLAFYLRPWIIQNTGADSPLSPGIFNISLVASTHGIEQFSGGMGTAVLMAFLMRLCKKEFKASHYAIGSGLMAVSGVFAGLSSGIFAGWLGYGWMFFISFVAALPALAIIPFLSFERVTES